MALDIFELVAVSITDHENEKENNNMLGRLYRRGPVWHTKIWWKGKVGIELMRKHTIKGKAMVCLSWCDEKEVVWSMIMTHAQTQFLFASRSG